MPVLKGKVVRLLAAGAALVLLAAYFIFDPASSAIFPPCPVRKLCGLDCPGCGAQRALHALLHLHIGEAFRFNPLMLASTPFLLLDRLTSAGPLRHRNAPWFVLGILILFGVIRNLPLYPF